jgi:hypothetical protein
VKASEKVEESPVKEKTSKSLGKEGDSSPVTTAKGSPTKDDSLPKKESKVSTSNTSTPQSSEVKSASKESPKEQAPSLASKPAEKPQVKKAFDSPSTKDNTPSKELSKNEDEEEEIVSTEDKPSTKKNGALTLGEESHPFSLN